VTETDATGNSNSGEVNWGESVAVAYLPSSGTPGFVTRSTICWLQRLGEERISYSRTTDSTEGICPYSTVFDQCHALLASYRASYRNQFPPAPGRCIRTFRTGSTRSIRSTFPLLNLPIPKESEIPSCCIPTLRSPKCCFVKEMSANLRHVFADTNAHPSSPAGPRVCQSPPNFRRPAPDRRIPPVFTHQGHSTSGCAGCH